MCCYIAVKVLQDLIAVAIEGADAVHRGRAAVMSAVPPAAAAAAASSPARCAPAKAAAAAGNGQASEEANVCFWCVLPVLALHATRARGRFTRR